MGNKLFPFRIEPFIEGTRLLLSKREVTKSLHCKITVNLLSVLSLLKTNVCMIRLDCACARSNLRMRNLYIPEGRSIHNAYHQVAIKGTPTIATTKCMFLQSFRNQRTRARRHASMGQDGNPISHGRQRARLNSDWKVYRTVR